MSTANPLLLLLLRHNKLEVFSTTESEPQLIEFPQNVVEFLDIKDQHAFETLYEDFLKSKNYKKLKAILMLSPDALFRKTLQGKEKNEEDNELNEFTKRVPLDHDVIIANSVELKNEVVCFATNKIIIHTLLRIATKYGIHIQAIIPQEVAELDIKEEKPTAEQINQLFEKLTILKKYTFFQEKFESTNIQAIHKVKYYLKNNEFVKLPVRTQIMAGISLFVVIGCIAVVIKATSPVDTAKSKPSSAPIAKNVQQIENTNAQKNEATTSSSQSAIPKSKVTILLQYNAETTETATTLLTSLKTKGYLAIKSQNVGGVTPEFTKIQYNKTTSKDHRKEITEIIRVQYPDSEITINTTAASSDVTIILGKS